VRKHTNAITIRLTPDLHDALRERVSEELSSTSVVARQALDQYLYFKHPKNNASISPTNMKNNTSDFQDFMELYQLFKELKG